MGEEHPLYVGDRKKPKNCPDMRRTRDLMQDPVNEGRKAKVNKVSLAEAQKEWASSDTPR